MNELEKSDPGIWEGFLNGHWVVNKCSVPFSALGVDKTLEHENGRMNVQGGLTGITLNGQQEQDFFRSCKIAMHSSNNWKMFIWNNFN